MAAIEAQRRTENALAGLLHGPGDIDELAAIKAEEWSDLRLFDLLASLKTTCGGESVASPHKTAGENQTVAVAPGISLSLAHDAGYWYAQLTLKGVSARRFLTSGGPTVWQARGATPQEATASLARAMGKSRRAVLVESYAKRILDDDSVG
jgi:hypothetical protein